MDEHTLLDSGARFSEGSGIAQPSTHGGRNTTQVSCNANGRDMTTIDQICISSSPTSDDASLAGWWGSL